MTNLSKEEQLNLDIREAELKDFLDNNPRAKKLQDELDLKMLCVPDDKRLEVLFLMMGGLLSENKYNLDKLEKVVSGK
jgi:hypothetical protein